MKEVCNANTTPVVCLASFAPSAVAGTLPCPPTMLCPTGTGEVGIGGTPTKTSSASADDSCIGMLEVSRWSELSVTTPVEGALPVPTSPIAVLAPVESTRDKDATLKSFLLVSRANTKPGRGSRLKRRARLRPGAGLASFMLYGPDAQQGVRGREPIAPHAGVGL